MSPFPVRFAARSLVVLVLVTVLTPARGAPTHLVEQSPVLITNVAPGVCLVDFGRVAFGNLRLSPSSLDASNIVPIRFGEDLTDERINRHPPGSVRYAEITISLNG